MAFLTTDPWQDPFGSSDLVCTQPYSLHVFNKHDFDSLPQLARFYRNGKWGREWNYPLCTLAWIYHDSGMILSMAKNKRSLNVTWPFWQQDGIKESHALMEGSHCNLHFLIVPTNPHKNCQHHRKYSSLQNRFSFWLAWALLLPEAALLLITQDTFHLR